MSLDLDLSCPACAAEALADDEFCEHCGTPLGLMDDAARNHVEVRIGSGVGAVSDRGLVHRRNEDAVFVATTGAVAVAVVCDGVSASAAAHVASAVAAASVGDALVEGAPMSDALAAGAATVQTVPWMATGAKDAPSCTVVALRWDGVDATIGWAGDSRAYWVDAGGAWGLTIDHSWAREQVDAGVMTSADAEADGRAHAITRWLGADAPTAEAAVIAFRPPGAGRIVLCTDGLWNLVTIDSLARVAYDADATAPAVAAALTRLALARGGHDNVTVAVVDVPGGNEEATT